MSNSEILLFCMVGLLPNFVIEETVNFLQWYKFGCCTKEFDKRKLDTMDNFMIRYVLPMHYDLEIQF